MSFKEQERKIRLRRLKGEQGCRFSHGGQRALLLYPSPYRAAMSSLGYQWILRQLQDAGFAAERAFLPDDPAKYKHYKIPLLSFESQTPLSSFPEPNQLAGRVRRGVRRRAAAAAGSGVVDVLP